MFFNTLNLKGNKVGFMFALRIQVMSPQALMAQVIWPETPINQLNYR